ncbi:MAG: metallophosphoesterase, partial [Nitrososphaerales archaeon]
IKMIPDEPALLLRTRRERVLVIPDLHLGFEKAFVERGIAFPSQTEKLFSRIRRLVQSHRPGRLVFLGDIKHGTSIIHPHEWKEVPRFFERLLKLVDRVDVIPGNHDGDLDRLLPRKVALASVRGLIIEDGRKKISLVHGHAWPGPESFGCEELIMGHHHFTIMLRDSSGLRSFEPVWVVARWNRRKSAASFLKSMGIRTPDPIRFFRKNFGVSIKNPRIIVMPTFNQTAGARAINRKETYSTYLRPIFKSGLVDIRNSELYMLDGTYLGRLSHVVDMMDHDGKQ